MQRNPNESFTDYRARRAAANKAVKALKNGVVAHDSSYYGTYHNPEKRALQGRRKARKAAKKQTSN